MASVDLNAKIPNNVGLADDRKLQKALEASELLLARDPATAARV